MKFFKSLIFVLISFISQAQSQKNIDHQSILWTRYYNQLLINNSWSIHTEFDNRVFLKPIEQNLFVFRIQGRYKINEQLEAGIGYAYFSVTTQDPEVTPDFEVPENRGQQDITWKQNMDKVNLYQRFQVEQRFVHNANSQGLTDGTTFFWRFRYRFQADYTFWKKQQRFLKAVVNDEIMINAGKNIIYNTFDQNRIYGALQVGFNDNLAIELGYLNSFQQRANGVDYFNRNIIRLSIIHKINLKKTK
ncbi:DUF2490 domain-containing protein [Flavobacterium luteum]|uniref:DUF2490 domain-containing protein n=1 Tax=Flavobacterium luteum TaxID=2026654 RepID=A0A7J5AGA0_9FLAO|nr:DUF2490 domain-containing protein [Flavobacterium luteum]KAB1156622.1 DUF2490 domain-containing protein [Flavobacterium luteum]